MTVEARRLLMSPLQRVHGRFDGAETFVALLAHLESAKTSQ
jgi:hypothetical protein